MPTDYTALAKKFGAVESTPSAAGGTDYAALAKKYGATASEQPAAATAAPAASSGVFDTLADVGDGLQKGLLSTIYHTGDLIRRATGMERIIDRPYEQSLITPKGTAQQVGNFAEKGIEMLVAGGPVGAAAKGLEAATVGVRGARALNTIGKAGLEAAGAAGVAGLQTGGDTTAMKEAALAGGIGSVAGQAIGAVAKTIPAKLKASAVEKYEKVLNPGGKRDKYLTDKIVPGLLDRRVVATSMSNLKGKVDSMAEKFGEQLGAKFDAIPDEVALDVRPVLKHIEEGAEQFTMKAADGSHVAMGPEAKRGLQNQYDLYSALVSAAKENPETGALEVSVKQLRKFRQYADDVAARAGAYSGRDLAAHSTAEAHKLAGNGVREEMAKAYPDIAEINREFSFWKKAQQVVDNTIERKVGQQGGLGKKIAGAAAGAVGLANGGVITGILSKAAGEKFESIITSPAWRTVDANLRNRLADALVKGDKVQAGFYIQKIANTLGGAAASSGANSESAMQTSR